MRRISRKQAILTGIGLLVLAALVLALLPDPVPVQTAEVARRPLRVVVEEEGETRISDRYVVAAPVGAYLRRVELEAGDPVEAGQALVRLEPPRSPPLDPRNWAEAASRVTAARAAVFRAEVEAEQVRSELERTRRLHEAGAATRQALEAAASRAAAAGAALESARAELRAAQSAQESAAGAGTLPVEGVITAPASGRVLRVHRESEGPVSPGEPLLEVGATEQLQVVAEVLSQDAVRITPGVPVLLEDWGGAHSLEAVVTRVDPEGFTRVSALGVEERRVRVTADLVSPPEARRGLGAGYRVLARFIVWQAQSALQVPTAAVFRHDGGWAVFVVEGGRARLRAVEPGQEAGLVTEIRSGLEPGEVVVVHPGNEVEDGARVTTRGV